MRPVLDSASLSESSPRSLDVLCIPIPPSSDGVGTAVRLSGNLGIDNILGDLGSSSARVGLLRLNVLCLTAGSHRRKTCRSCDISRDYTPYPLSV